MFGNGKGLFGGNPLAMQPEPQKAPQQGGFGGFLQRAQMPLAQIADTLLRYSGSGGSPVLARLQQQQDMQQIQGFRTQQAKQQQDAEQQQWMARQAWERANPAPRDPYHWRNNNGDLMELGPDGQARVAYDDPQDRINWVQVRDAATGAITLMPMGPNGPMGGNNGATPPDELPADFDFGAASQTGGAASSPMSATQSRPPVSSTTSEGLGAMISVHGVGQVEQWMRSGALTVRNR